MQVQWSEHENFIRRAIALAALSRAGGDEPFGALLVLEGREVLYAQNSVRVEGDPTNHAEMRLVREACRKLTHAQLAGSTLYSSTEPCPMCTGAIYWSGIRRVVFSFPALELREMANDRFLIGCNTLFDRANQRTAVLGPVLPDEGREVHVGFWSGVEGGTGH